MSVKTDLWVFFDTVWFTFKRKNKLLECSDKLCVCVCDCAKTGTKLAWK